jgi:hypothetical protein
VLIQTTNPAGTTTYTGDGASGVHLWGAQLEVNSGMIVATSYIPTQAASVTRNTDQLQYAFLNNVGKIAGAAYIEATPLSFSGVSHPDSGLVGGESAQGYFLFGASGRGDLTVYDGTTNVQDGGAGAWVLDQLGKYASTWGGTTMSLAYAFPVTPAGLAASASGAFDGDMQGTSTNFAIGGLPTTGGGADVGACAAIKNVRCWVRKLSPEQLITIVKT